MNNRNPSIRAWLAEPIHPCTVGLARIVLGLALVYTFFNFSQGIAPAGLTDSEYRFPYPLLGWLPAPSLENLKLGGALLVCCALLFTVGYLYRFAASALFIGYSYFFLVDQTYYNNHYYLISLLLAIFAVTPADAWGSLASLTPRRAVTSPLRRWHLTLLQFQVIIPYFYGGIAKLNKDWLSGQPLQRWLEENGGLPLLDGAMGELLSIKALALVMSYGGLFLDLSIGFFLLSSRYRWLALIPLTAFHITNAHLFTIGVFPWLMLGLTVLFVPSRDVASLFHQSTHLESSLSRSNARLSVLTSLTLCVYLAIQCLVPLRHWLLGADPSWSEEGRYFAWHMKIRDKNVATRLVVMDEDGFVRSIIDPEHHLKGSRGYTVAKYPRMIWQLAQQLEQKLIAQGFRDPEIRAVSLASLNGRAYTLLMDPRVDLTKVQYPNFTRPDWILIGNSDSPPGVYPNAPVLDRQSSLVYLTSTGADEHTEQIRTLVPILSGMLTRPAARETGDVG